MSTPPQSPGSPDATASPTEQVGSLGAKTAQREPEAVDLPSGRELSELDALSMAAARPVRWVVIAGNVDSGKTTLLTSLYELLQWGPIDGYRFAGSVTLPGFEQRCHLSRSASERDEADTPRTLYRGPEPKYLHLRLSPTGETQEMIDCLFTDVSGEMFEHARDSTEECKEMTFLRRAKAFLLVLDGEKVLKRDKRWMVVEEATSLLRSCLDSRMIAEDCVVTIAWSKVDYFVNAPDLNEIAAFQQDVETRFRTAFESRVGLLKFTRIAARPSKARQLGFGNGLSGLLKDWISNSPVNRKMVLFSEPPRGSRESELYGLRHPAPQEAE